MLGNNQQLFMNKQQKKLANETEMFKQFSNFFQAKLLLICKIDEIWKIVENKSINWKSKRKIIVMEV